MNGLNETGKKGSYSSPKSHIYGIFATQVICDSPIFGNDNEAGSAMNESSGYTYDY